MNGKIALIVLDPEIASSTIQMYITKMNNLMHFLEMRLLVSPRIKKLNKRYINVSIVSSENSLIKDLAKKEGISVSEGYISEQDVNNALEQAIKLSKEWHIYGKLPKLLQVLDVNVAEVFQEELVHRFFLLFKQIELASTVIENEHPDIVYVQSILFPLGQAFNVVAAAKKAECSFLEPKLYRTFKDWLQSRLRRKLSVSYTPKYYNIYLTQQKYDYASQYNVLMDTPSINYFNALFPVIQEISNRRDCKCYIRGKESDFLGKLKNIQRISIKDVNVTAYKEKHKEIRTYYQSKLKSDSEFQNIFVYKGINFWNAIERDISYWLEKRLADATLDIVHFSNVIDEIRPDILVVGTDSAVAMRGHVLIAKQKGIPVLEVQHGVYLPTWWRAVPYSDKIAAGGDYSKEIYVGYGAQKEQIVVTGWPKFDDYVKLKESLVKTHKNGTDILFATQPIDIKLNHDIIEAIGAFIADSTRIRLIVKPHPAENTKTYNQITKKYKNVILHKSSENISKLVASSDILITVFSTVAIEAALLDKSIICINITNEESMYVNSGIAIEVKKLGDIIPAIKDVLYNEETREKLAEARKIFVYEQTYIQDGKASKRVADLIIQMIEESKE
jgi:UDP-N-acetylglucosamine 2-epimerase